MLLAETYKDKWERNNPTIWFNRGFFNGYIQLDNGYWFNSFTLTDLRKWTRSGEFIRLTKESKITDLIN